VERRFAYRLGGEWHEVWSEAYRYGGDGFLERVTFTQRPRAITVSERYRYRKVRDGVQLIHEESGWKASIRKDPGSGDWEIEHDDVGYARNKARPFQEIVAEVVRERFVQRHKLFLKSKCWDDTKPFESVLSLEFACDAAEPEEFVLQVNLQKDVSENCPCRVAERNDEGVVFECPSGEKRYRFGKRDSGYQVERECWDDEEKEWAHPRECPLESRRSIQESLLYLVTGMGLYAHDYGTERETIYYDKVNHSREWKYTYHDTGEKTRDVAEVKRKDAKTVASLRVDRPHWCQSDATPLDPDGQPMAFIAELEYRGVFGSLYLFYSPKHHLFSQVFQCT